MSKQTKINENYYKQNFNVMQGQTMAVKLIKSKDNKKTIIYYKK